MVNLRPYQEDAVAAVLSAAKRKVQRALYAMPTGCGKTVTFVELHRRWPVPGITMVVAHREELLEQAAQSFLRADPACRVGFEQGTRYAPRDSQVIVASVQTLGREDSERLEWARGQVRLLVVDEGHHAVASTYQRVAERFGCFDPGGPFLCGCTATPKRLDRLSLQSIFQEQVYSYNIRAAIKDGWLADVRGIRVASPIDLDDVDTTAGDFNQNELARKVNVEARTEAALNTWQQRAADRSTIIFCADVAHAESAARIWRGAGITAEHVHGKMKTEERKAVLARFKSGETQVLANVEILTEGFDHPPTSCIVMLRPTQSWGLYMQMAGRGTRLAPGKDALLVIDVVDNCRKHNLATVPAILDLPPGLDLQGESLAKTAKQLDELGERVSWLAGYEPKTFAELSTIVERIDLFAAVESPEVVTEQCRQAWLRVREGVYLLDCAGKEKRLAWLVSDGCGEWMLRLEAGGRLPNEMGFPDDSPNGELALRRADGVVGQIWPDALNVTLRSAPWRAGTPSDKQLDMLRKRGYPEDALLRLDKGQVGSLITATLRRSQAEALARHFRAAPESEVAA